MMAVALDKFKLREFAAMGKRIQCCCGNSIRTSSGKPRVSGPINNATERFKLEVCGVSVPFVVKG